ncbi:MAG: hypothetical protein JW744_01425 [Candidatus Diapherotrites archaeon]|uniref:Uncharacterized protein n=1 Tax=Candidatus Iainarchaeum sp. TaxID=3101447 RepID=A0A938YS86_9ARCH|nr:hypothetical protein [Candidatus Diapherotrites archaeon]
MPKRQRPKSQWPAAKRRALKASGLKRISPSKAERRVYGQAMAKILGYKPLKLSDVVAKPSRYRLKARQLVRETTKEWVPAEYRQEPIPWQKQRTWGPTERQVLVRPGRYVNVKGKVTGERLVVKRVTKGHGKRKGSSSGERVSHKTGSLKARVSKAKKLGGKRGARPRRAKKKKKKR